MEATGVFAALCYTLLIAVFVLDLYTPQLFIAAILSNVPIALSSLALRERLTIGLVAGAEIANVLAGYFNGVQAGRHWDAIAIGDRALLAASFLLIGYMTVQTQRLGRSAGLSDARADQADRERRLRLAFDRIRESLNVELVPRAIVREAVAFFDADRAMLVLNAGASGEPRWYLARPNERDVTVSTQSLEPDVRSFIARDWPAARSFGSESADTIARHALATLAARHGLATPVRQDDGVALLLLLRAGDRPWGREEEANARSFGEQASVALAQANLFARLGDQTNEIAEQHRRLLERSHVIRDIVYALAHDLRTPLSAANVTIRQAQAGAYGDLPSRYREVLTTTLRSNEELQRMVETLLLVARYEAGEISPVRESVDLHKIALEVAEEFRPLARERNVNLAVEGAPSRMLGDEREIRRAVINLVANALTATPAEGSVTIRTSESAGVAALAVDDTGFGVPPDRRASLFERFAGQQMRQPGGGTGLGLYIVRRIAQAHGGKARYDPLPTRGSRFSLEFPSAA